MEPISLRTPLALLLISLAVIASVWWWLATPITLVRAPIDPAAKLQCVSYTPFRGAQTPLDPTTQIPVEQIEQDLTDLAKVTDCVRTYSIENGLDQVPGVAAKVGLKVMQGIWLSSNRFKNLQQIAIAVRLAKEYPGVVTSLIVGNEVLLRGEMTANDLAGNIRAVKAAAGNLPVTYADVWEYWVKNREIYDAVDFVTIHILPYWEDIPVKAKYAAAHVDDIRKRMAVTFPGKEILIGETGWPSQGRMREGALPSRTNQARVVSEILDLAKREGFRVNLIEAYDQPWKRKLEGTVGGNWGLFDSVKRQVKYPPGVAITNYPDWKLQMAGGMALSVATFLAAWLTLRRRPWTPRPSAWIAVAISATTAGALLGIAGDKMYYESYGVGGWLHWGVLLAAGIAAPLLTAHALIAGRSLPTFLELIGPRDYRGKGVIGAVLAIVLIITTVIAAETALGFTFDPRYRDFPYASLTMAVVPFALLTMLNRPKEGIRPLAESVFAGLLAIAALYTIYNEGTINWQSDWTCVMYLLLAATLWRARAAQNPG
ncbi:MULTISPECIES: glycoside hydrolase family 17 protein [Bradyrhizobium]|uniref:glycoside hydrolase family 17 protein n=1 Tax=Bradyrhizobium elkanii TaxID=29448 RepID=UPI002714C4F3|nr:beta-(1-6) glucans synthase [Bradyrhizobium elkanii]WLA52538.1 beta-(1-6) glucans synthase [Bradyrhizobium elkanii]WLB77157.1 beta-(1-6) glucans synthase [Bradyrhizobium elkanii]